MEYNQNNDLYEYKLVKSVLENDRKAQKELYDRYAPRMMTLCRRYACDAHEAKEFLQEGFIRVFKYLPQFKCRGSLEGWIRKIIINVILRAKTKNIHFQDLQDVYINDSSETEILNEIDNEKIIQLINQLPKGYRLIFNLYVIEGYTHKEIAQELNISESTSRSQLVRAKAQLKKSTRNLHEFVILSHE